VALAQEAHALVQVDPKRAAALAERALELAEDAEAEVAARYALGWAQHALGEAVEGDATLRAGIRLARKSGDERGEGLLRRLLAVQLSLDGRHRAARRELDAALALLSGLDRAQSQVHRIEIVRRGARDDAELHRRVTSDAAAALRRLRREGDALWEARLRFNRGLLHTERGELARAESDIAVARSLYLRAGAEPAALNASAVLAHLTLARGDVLGCLRLLAPIDLSSLPAQVAYNVQKCRLLAFTQARLLPEARTAAEAWLALCDRTGGRDFVPEAMLDLASIALMAGDAGGSGRFAVSAMRSFAARGKPVEAALARATVLRARLAAGQTGPASVRGGRQVVRVLESAGWRREAARARLLVARLALAGGSVAVARRELTAAGRLRTLGLVNDRIELCHAQALLALAEARPWAAEKHLLRGVRLLDDYRAALGAVELRAASSSIGAEIAQDGLRVALASRRPERVLAWAERLRASALRLPPVRPPKDAKLQSLQTELRDAVTRKAVGAQARLETAIRTRSRLVDSVGDSQTESVGAEQAASMLGPRALVEYVELDGVLHALTLVDGRLALHELGASSADNELAWLSFALRQLARGRTDAGQRAAARDGARTAAAALDALLGAPLLPTIGAAPLVVVPTGALYGLPWGELPSLRGRAVTVVPSLAMWVDLARRPHSRRRKVAIVAGPRLRHAAAEARDLAELFPDAQVLQGRAATVTSTLQALDGAALAHLACHGHFRSDSPLFSSLELADGPLNVYDLQNLRRPPGIVVLSACDLALSRLHPGDELLGVAAALLGMGTSTIVASVVPVPDSAARRLMVAFHRGLMAGSPPAAALAKAQTAASMSGFVCLGLG